MAVRKRLWKHLIIFYYNRQQIRLVSDGQQRGMEVEARNRPCLDMYAYAQVVTL